MGDFENYVNPKRVKSLYIAGHDDETPDATGLLPIPAGEPDQLHPHELRSSKILPSRCVLRKSYLSNRAKIRAPNKGALQSSAIRSNTAPTPRQCGHPWLPSFSLSRCRQTQQSGVPRAVWRSAVSRGCSLAVRVWLPTSPRSIACLPA